MRLPAKLRSAGGALWLYAAGGLGCFGQAGGMIANPTDPGLDPSQMGDILLAPVPSLRAALAANPAAPDDIIRRLVRDPYDGVANAALAVWKIRYPSSREFQTLPRGAGVNSASPDYAELRAMIDGKEGVAAALAWRHLDEPTRKRLIGVCHYEKAQDRLEPLLDFIVMAEPPGGPLAAAMASQIIPQDPRQLDEMKKRGLTAGLPSFGVYSAAIDAHMLWLIRSLADSGLSLDDRGEEGMTPLMVAARTGDMGTILLLLELGAEAGATDDKALTAADYARRSLKVDAAGFLSLTPERRAKAAALKRRFSRARRGSAWVGRWIADPYGFAPQKFAAVDFAQDGTFDITQGPAGSWSELDATHLRARPMPKEDPVQGSSPVLFGDLDFERLSTAPAQIQVRYYGAVLLFNAAPRDPEPEYSYPETVPSAVAGAVAIGLQVPTGLKAVAQLDAATLSWEPSTNASEYFIYRDGSLLTMEPVVGIEFIDADAPAAASASYQVQAVAANLRVSSPSPAVAVAMVLADTDGRGLPDRWQMRFFGHLGVDPNADPDGDGLTNIEEFRKGSDPTDFFNGVSPVVEPLYGSTAGPQDQLAMIVRHPDGTPWVNAPVPANVSIGRRLFSAVRNQPPYVSSLVVHTDANGMAQVFLQPLR